MEKILKPVNEKERVVRLSYVFIVGIFIILLGISLISAVTTSDDDSSLITIEGGTVCSANGNTWIDTDTGVTTPTTGPFGVGNCRTPGPRTCCPRGHICEGITDTCVLTDKNICNDLNEDECGDYLQVVADKSINDIKASNYCGTLTPGSTSNCVNVTDCSCAWDGVDCNAVDQQDEYCHTPDVTNPLGTCTYTVQGTPIDKCNEDGFMYYQWQGTGSLQGCIENTGLRPVPCESLVRLGFFNWISFIAVIFILGIYYFIVIIKTPQKNSY